MENNAPVGQRFSHVYLERGEPTSDSDRMRLRLLNSAKAAIGIDEWDMASAISTEMGIDIGTPKDVRDFYLRGDLTDVLDSITILWRVAVDRDIKPHRGSSPIFSHWVRVVRRIFKEENVGYSIDDEGGVHYLVDETFEQSKRATIRGLAAQRYGAVRYEFEAAYKALDIMPPDTKAAVRSTFESLETLFKLLLPRCQRLGTDEIKKQLKPLVEGIYPDGTPHRRAATLLITSFEKWVSAAHFYRHAQGVEEPAPPPMDLCILMMSQGAGWLRWLIEIDQAVQGAAGQGDGQDGATS